MDTDFNQEKEVTESSKTLANEESDTQKFTQEDLNRIVAERVLRERKSFEKRFEGVDLEKYNQWQQQEEQRELEQKKQRGEFEKILKEQAEKYQSQISGLKETLQREKVDGSLLNAASKLKSVAPSQVVDLLKSRVRLIESGEAEVVTLDGTPAYKEDGTYMTVDELVGDFLRSNPHFASATPAGTGSQSKVGGVNSQEFDITQLDMSNPKDRAKFAEYRKKQGRI
jgi:hypothetical protein